MLIVTLYTKMSEYAQKTVVINIPMNLSFHILCSLTGPGNTTLAAQI
jgi:hypothetical protein